MYLGIVGKMTGKMGQCVVGTNYQVETGFTSLNSWNTSTSEMHVVLYHQGKLSKDLKHLKRSTLQSLQMFVERRIEASIKLFRLLSPLTSVTQMKNVKYMKIVNTFIICWNNFKRTHAYLGMGGRDMGIEGNK